MYEVGAHQAARRPALFRARVLVDICYLPQPAVSNGSREGRNRRHGRCEPDTLRACRDMSEHLVRTREHAETAEVMLADPGGIQPYLFGVDRLVEDVGDDLIGAAPIILVVVVAQREVAEFHFFSFLLVLTRTSRFAT